MPHAPVWLCPCVDDSILEHLHTIGADVYSFLHSYSFNVITDSAVVATFYHAPSPSCFDISHFIESDTSIPTAISACIARVLVARCTQPPSLHLPPMPAQARPSYIANSRLRRQMLNLHEDKGRLAFLVWIFGGWVSFPSVRWEKCYK